MSTSLTRANPPDFLKLEAERLSAAFAKALDAARPPGVRLARKTLGMLQADRTAARDVMLAGQAAALSDNASTEQKAAYTNACAKFAELGQKTNAARAALKQRIVDQQPTVFSEILPLVESAKASAHTMLDRLEQILAPMVAAASAMRQDGFELSRALENSNLAITHLRQVRAALNGAT